MRRYLIVANQTLGAEELVQFVRTRTEAEPSEFFIVVPATPVMEMVHGAEGVPAVGGGTVLPSSPEHAHELAQERLETALAQLRGSVPRSMARWAIVIRSMRWRPPSRGQTVRRDRRVDPAQAHVSVAPSRPAPPPRAQDPASRHPRRRRR